MTSFSLALDSIATNSAESLAVDREAPSGKGFLAALARMTVGPRCLTTVDAQSIDATSCVNLCSTLSTGVGDLFPSTVFGPAQDAPPEGFVGFIRTPTEDAGKVVGVVFQVPEGRVFSVVLRTIDYLKILYRVVQPVAVFMVDVLSGFKKAVQRKFHQEPVDLDRNDPALFGPRRVRIAARIVNSASSTIDGDVLLESNFSIVGYVDFHKESIPWET